MFLIGKDHVLVINAVAELNPVDFKRQFSEEPPIIVVFSPQIIRAPTKSISLQIK